VYGPRKAHYDRNAAELGLGLGRVPTLLDNSGTAPLDSGVAAPGGGMGVGVAVLTSEYGTGGAGRRQQQTLPYPCADWQGTGGGTAIAAVPAAGENKGTGGFAPACSSSGARPAGRNPQARL
jgi:hypothetical protein